MYQISTKSSSSVPTHSTWEQAADFIKSVRPARSSKYVGSLITCITKSIPLLRYSDNTCHIQDRQHSCHRISDSIVCIVKTGQGWYSRESKRIRALPGLKQKLTHANKHTRGRCICYNTRLFSFLHSRFKQQPYRALGSYSQLTCTRQHLVPGPHVDAVNLKPHLRTCPTNHACTANYSLHPKLLITLALS